MNVTDIITVQFQFLNLDNCQCCTAGMKSAKYELFSDVDQAIKSGSEVAARPFVLLVLVLVRSLPTLALMRAACHPDRPRRTACHAQAAGQMGH